MDRIIIENMRIYGYHGAFKEESILGQEFLISLRVGLDLRKVGEEGSLDNGVSYATLYEYVERLVTKNSVELLETLGENIARNVIGSFNVEEVEVTVKKPNAPIPGIFDYVGVEIKRTRKDYEK